MEAYGWPLLYALFLWWFGTGLILYLDGLPGRTYRWSLSGATVLLVFALWGLVRSADQPTVTGAYVAFTSALFVWGWHEIGFLTGAVTGPVRHACPPGVRGWRRFAYATGAVLWHELAIAMTGVLVVICTWDGANHVGTWTFMIFWWMRLSAKFNVYLGVRNLTEEFLPPRLKYLSSYFRRKPINPFWPLSVLVSTVAAVMLWQIAFAPGSTPFQAVGFTFLGALLSLAVLEHWLMILPLPAARLWDWGLRSHARTAQADTTFRSTNDPDTPPHADGASPGGTTAPEKSAAMRKPATPRHADAQRDPTSRCKNRVGELIRPVAAPTTVQGRWT